jgi:hypothetical protein
LNINFTQLLNHKLMEIPNRNSFLWRKAKARAKFKTVLGSYLVVNAGLWTLWAFTSSQYDRFPWPAFVAFFWGIGLVRLGMAAYGSFNYQKRTQREYDRLVQQGDTPPEPLL